VFGPIQIAFVLLCAALAGYGCLLTADKRRRKLSERVMAVANRNNEEERPTATLAVLQRTDRRRRIRLFDWAVLILRFNPRVPALNVIPWRLVFIIGAAVGLGATWAAGLWLNKSGTLGGMALSVAVGAGVGLLAIRTIFSWERSRYRQKLFRQLPDAVDLTVSSSLAGLPVSEAFRNIAEAMRSPTREEFALVVNDISLGATVESSLMRLHDRTGVSEYAIFAMVISVQSQGGGRLTESLQHLAEMVRQRVAIGQRAYALAGEARLSATILMALPFVAATVLSIITPGYLDPLFADPRGVRLFMFAVISLILGFLTMRQMIQWATGSGQ
jgi:tight adherence protein B